MSLLQGTGLNNTQWNLDITKGQGSGEMCSLKWGFIIMQFSVYFTITNKSKEYCWFCLRTLLYRSLLNWAFTVITIMTILPLLPCCFCCCCISPKVNSYVLRKCYCFFLCSETIFGYSNLEVQVCTPPASYMRGPKGRGVMQKVHGH